eukprot:12145787-Alexandrium_andersonii.AAC.1
MMQATSSASRRGGSLQRLTGNCARTPRGSSPSHRRREGPHNEARLSPRRMSPQDPRNKHHSTMWMPEEGWARPSQEPPSQGHGGTDGRVPTRPSGHAG